MKKGIFGFVVVVLLGMMVVSPAELLAMGKKPKEPVTVEETQKEETPWEIPPPSGAVDVDRDTQKIFDAAKPPVGREIAVTAELEEERSM